MDCPRQTLPWTCAENYPWFIDAPPQVFVMASGNITYYDNLGNYTFVLNSYSTSSLLGIPRQFDWDYYALSFYDYDNDGDLDCLMTSFYKLSFYENMVSSLALMPFFLI